MYIEVREMGLELCCVAYSLKQRFFAAGVVDTRESSPKWIVPWFSHLMRE